MTQAGVSVANAGPQARVSTVAKAGVSAVAKARVSVGAVVGISLRLGISLSRPLGNVNISQIISTVLSRYSESIGDVGTNGSGGAVSIDGN